MSRVLMPNNQQPCLLERRLQVAPSGLLPMMERKTSKFITDSLNKFNDAIDEAAEEIFHQFYSRQGDKISRNPINNQQ